MSSITLTREQLYERVWSQPTIKIAAELGLSDVAVKKMCRRMNVPTPPRGYWARLTAGQKLHKPALPKEAGITPVRIDTARNAQRREEADRLATAQALMTPLELPEHLTIAQLHLQARAVHAALKKAKPDHHGRVETPIGDFPDVEVGVASIDRVCRALHVIFSELESRGVSLKQVSVHDRPRLGFVRGTDEAAFLIEEPIATLKREPTPEERRRPSREWKTETTQPSGLFKVIGFTISTSPYNPSYRWTQRAFHRNEGPRRPIGTLLQEVVDRIWEHFVQQDQVREQKKKEAAAEAERQKAEAERKRLAAEARAAETARRKEEERQEQHRQKLTALAAARVENALRAAEWWRLHQVLLAYASECERHWQTRQPASALTEDQTQWLAWLRREAQAMSPFALGYPDFSKDGPFDGTGIPIDGPYPPITTLPLPPTMPALSEPAPPKEAPKATTAAPPPPPAATCAPPQPQFPFWLLHRNRH